ncbi:MAG: 3'-5' exoribonuclease [Bacteroidetes bacterium]|nr:3'-5' exoribonuclease [Bacteroidota bacterium]
MYAIIDVETTGGSPSLDRVAEIAIVVFDGKEIKEIFSTLINPKRLIDPYVTRLTGITNEMVKNSPTFEDVHERILELTHENIFVAHNVKFDFGMLRQEFRRIGIDFNRKQMDTVNLARKVLPGHNSYSLGNICESVGIDISDRHRALGDAKATVKLLEVILGFPASAKYMEVELNHGIDADLLPPYLSKAEIEKLPEDAGVFYYKDEVGKILYLEGTKSIRRKVINDFSSPSNHPERLRMFELMRHIDYELSGNELIAKVFAHREITAHEPEFNKKQHITPYTHGIYLEIDEQDFAQLKIHSITSDRMGDMLKFSSKASANKVLAKIIRESNLYPWFALRSKMKENGIDTNSLKNYNHHIEKALKKYLYKQPNFFIIGQGIHPDDHSVVWVENNSYKGYGYFNPELTEAKPEILKEVIKPGEDDNEIQKIIRQQLRKQKDVKLLVY